MKERNNPLKIDNRKNYYLVLDVETANTIGQPLVYDLGFKLVDTMGRVYKQFSFVINEIFWDEKKIYKNPKMMNSAYYAEKLPLYYKGIYETKEFTCKPLRYAKAVIDNICKEYNVKAICAYNATFDTKALRNTIRYVTKSETAEFLPIDVEIYDIWNMACETICNTNKYAKFCLENEYYSKANNMMTSAEVVYRYLTDNNEFEEAHTGLADVDIESEIMAKIFKSYRGFNKGIEPMPWKKPQSKFKKLIEEA